MPFSRRCGDSYATLCASVCLRTGGGFRAPAFLLALSRAFQFVDRFHGSTFLFETDSTECRGYVVP